MWKSTDYAHEFFKQIFFLVTQVMIGIRDSPQSV